MILLRAKRFFQSLSTIFLSQNNQIIGGDFNCIELGIDRLKPGADDVRLTLTLNSQAYCCLIFYLYAITEKAAGVFPGDRS